MRWNRIQSIVFTIALLLGATATAIAASNDGNNDDEFSKLVAEVPVTHDWLWISPDKPTITIDISNPSLDAAEASIQLLIKTDKRQFHSTQTKRQTVAGGMTAHIDFDLDLEPGFYICTVLLNHEEATSFVFGVDPQDISSPPDYQPDFQSYWAETIEALGKVDGQYTMTEIPEKSTAKRKVYLVEMHSLPDQTGDVIARAYYAEPVAPGTYPALIKYNAYDGGTDTPKCMSGDDNPEWAEIFLSNRGQQINNRPPYVNPYGTWLTYGLDSEEHYYYRGAYMDCVRAIDFLCSREKVQQNNIFAQGASQGGAFTVAAAALASGRLNAIAIAIPFLGDFPDYFEIAPWPGNTINDKRQELGMSEAEMYRVLSYFDIKNLATLVTCPVYMNFSLQDNTCPPHTNWAAYNNLASGEKCYTVNPTKGHSPTSNWQKDYKNFFTAHLKSADAVNTVLAEPVQVSLDPLYYNMMGQSVGKERPTTPGIYIHQGKRVAIR